MKKCMTLLLVLSCGINSVSAAQEQDSRCLLKPLLYTAGALGFAGASYWLNKTSKETAAKRKKGHILTKASANHTIAIPGTGIWATLGLSGLGIGAMGFAGMIKHGIIINRKDTCRDEKAALSTCLILLGQLVFYSSHYKIDCMKQEYIMANQKDYIEQLKINKVEALKEHNGTDKERKAIVEKFNSSLAEAGYSETINNLKTLIAANRAKNSRAIAQEDELPPLESELNQ